MTPPPRFYWTAEAGDWIAAETHHVSPQPGAVMDGACERPVARGSYATNRAGIKATWC
jgi:hypothetical protein